MAMRRCELRAAIMQANGGAAANSFVINIDAGMVGDINLVTELPTLNRNIRISGPAEYITVKRSVEAKFRIFTVAPGWNCEISYLTIRNGEAPGFSDAGGIYNGGTLTVFN